MSTRTLITTIAVVAAFLTFPVFASALPVSDPIAVHSQSQPAVPAPTSEPVVATSDDGTGTSTVLLIAALTLVAGAAIGAGGAVARARRGGALHA
jgi:hypothetical protein